MDSNYKKGVALVNYFDKAPLSKKELKKLKKKTVKVERNTKMSKNYLDQVPVNVLAEPTFDTEKDAYIHYAVKYNIEDIQEDALLYEEYINLPPLKKSRTKEHNDIDKKYKSRIKNIVATLSSDNTEKSEEEVQKEATKKMESLYSDWCEFKEKTLDAFKRIPLLISVDTGKHNTKYAYVEFDIVKGDYSDIITGCFESRVSEVNSITRSGISDITVINGKKFLISKEADRVCEDAKTDTAGKTKGHIYHRALFVEALRIVTEKTGRSLYNATVGTSVDTSLKDAGAATYLNMLDKMPTDDNYKNLTGKEQSEYRMKLMEELMDEFTGVTYNVEYGASEYEIHVADLIVSPETQSGAYALDIADFECEEYYNTYIVDIGGLNRTILAIIGGSPRMKDVDSDMDGMARIISDAVTYLTTNSGEYSEYDTIDRAYVERALKFYTIKEGQQLIDDFLFQYFDNLTIKLCSLKGCGFNKETGKLIFIGGASQSLKPFIEYYYTKDYCTKYAVEVVEDSLYTNVIGMYYFGQAKFAHRNKKRKALA